MSLNNTMVALVLGGLLVLAVAVAFLLYRAQRRMRRHNARLQDRSNRIEEQLKQAQRYEAVGVMAGSIVHNLNNLMSVILGHSRLIAQDLPKDAPAGQDLQQILKAGGMAADLLNEIADFSQQAEKALKPTHLTVPIQDTLKFLRDITPSNIRIREEIPGKCEPVMASKTGLQQLLMNLFSNSVHAIGKSTGLIEVSLQDSILEKDHTAVPRDLVPGHYLRLRLRDNGKGMGREVLEGIRHAFRVHPPDTTHMNTGLNTVFRILDQHNAAAVFSSTPDRGTTTDIYFPKIAWRVEHDMPRTEPEPEVSAPVLAETPDTTFQVVAGGRSTGEDPAGVPVAPEEELGTILLVDDDEMVARVTALGLQRMGYRVIKHLDSRRALADFLQTPELFDVVITDQIMPHMSGVRLARKIHSARPEIPVLLVTGVRDSFNDQQTLEAGIAQILFKPVSHRDLVEVVEKVRLRTRHGRG